jgi:hypothetical protein
MKSTVFWDVTSCNFGEGPTFRKDIFPQNKMTYFKNPFKKKEKRKSMYI